MGSKGATFVRLSHVWPGLAADFARLLPGHGAGGSDGAVAGRLQRCSPGCFGRKGSNFETNMIMMDMTQIWI